MNSKAHVTVNGLMLVDAPHSALNMLGVEQGAGPENQTVVKNIQRSGRDFPYVSAQALRYWWRNALATEKGWDMSPIERKDKNTVFTQARPWQYPDDDLFGYMRAQAEWIMDLDKQTGEPKRDNKGQPVYKKGKGRPTRTRISPLKCSPLVSVSPQRPTRDFSIMSRQNDDPAIYSKQFYSTVLRGIFSLDLTALGRFEQSNRSGFQNISEEGLLEAEIYGASVNGTVATLPLDERRKRASDVVSVLPYLSGGANQTLHLTDVTPKFVILTVLRGGNHLFMNVVKDERGNARINTDALKEVLGAYGDRLMTDVFIGRRTGFLDEQAEELMHLSEGGAGLPSIHVGEVNATIEAFVQSMSGVIE